ncbi:MAG: delta-60 repeat domain-containing protein [Rudaea sp.]
MQSTKRITQTAALLLAGLASVATAGPPLDSGALDAAFGSGGKVILNAAEAGATGSNFTATDIAVQSNGKTIVAGYTDNDCVLTRLNPDGSLDSSFGGTNGFSPGFAGYGLCSFTGIAVRADDRIVTVANQPDGVAIVSQFTAGGLPDYSGFGAQNGATFVAPASGDSTNVTRVVIESNGTIDVAGFYYQQSTNNNQFLFVQISADGKTVQPLFQYEFGSGQNQDDHAQDLAIDSQGRYVVVGYHRGASGNYDFAAIRIRSDLYDVDNTFGSGGQTTVDFGDNGDYANAVALTSTGYIALGGQANGQAALAMLDPDGNLNTYFSGGLLYPEKFTYNFGIGGGNDTITKLIVDGYDTKYPQLLAIGSGNQSGVPYGLMLGIARLDLPGTYSNFTLDTGFSGNGTEGVYFNERPDGIGLFTTTNHGRSAAFANGKLVVAGDTIEPGGTGIAVARVAAFDGIFKNGFDNPSL